MRRKTIVPALVACTVAVLALTTATLQAQHGETSAAPAITKAIAVLHATKSGGDAKGEVKFTKVAAGIKVEAEIHGLTPGPHGFHIHEFGDVSSPDAMSAGGHFNPDKAEHGAPTSPKRHVGDMGNIEASPRGVARLDYVDPQMSFAGPHSIIGRGVIVHEKADDMKQPTGNAGGRVAAGVVGVAKGS
jgi:Cu-Zn family superoxide dismutase